MNKLIVLFVLAFAGAAGAQPAEPAAAPAAGSAAAAQPAPPAESAAPTAAPTAPAGDAHKVCLDALNADPELAKRVVATYEKKAVEKIDAETLAAHQGAADQIAENERHVIYAYAAMWILAALFLVYMWRRQLALKLELAQLRRDLDAAAKESK